MMSRTWIRSDQRALALFALLSMAVGACHAAAAAPGASDAVLRGVDAVVPALHRSDLAVLIADASAARRQGDWQNLRRFQTALVERVGAAGVAAARADYRRAIADLRAAEARGDGVVRATLRAQLGDMCGLGSIVSAFETCAVEATTWGR